MIEFKLFFALISYYFVMFVTPGPNNAMLTASGIKFGFKKTIPHLIGIPFGHTIQITLVCFGLGNLFQKYPSIQVYLKWLCFIYLLYLGWKIIGSFSENNKESGEFIMVKVGEHIALDIIGTKKVYSPSFFEKIVYKIAKKAKVEILEISKHKFEPQGFTLIALLAESHMSFHTFPENNIISFDFFTCGKVSPVVALDIIKKKLNIKEL